MGAMSERRDTDDGQAHDVLAAEEFPMPAPDPELHADEAHDVLAAEEFAVPAPDPAIHHGPVELPADLTGSAEPRDVLAAEEFAMPAGPPGAHSQLGMPSGGGLGPLPVLVGAWLVTRVVRRWRRRRRERV
jgi:hypothetical protein